MIMPEEREKFEKSGYHYLPGLLSADEAQQYRMRINRAFGLPERELSNRDIDSKTYTLPDGITKIPDFWPLIFNTKLLETIRGLLGGDIRYTQHSDLHINLGAGKYHRDSAYRDFGVGPDWDESKSAYKVVRVAIYLSDYDNSGSSLVILPGTHRHESWLNRMEVRFWNELRTRWRRFLDTNSLPQWAISMPKTTIRHKPGDCLIFDQRVLHAGGVVAGAMPKYAAYLSFSLDNIHAYNHHAYYLSRPTYLRQIPEELSGQLEGAGLKLTSSQP
ncbi:phytanoyl-CoA dioxygenase family protein [Ferrovibrio sp.]|uniref:phytanoyl-CoA dioxygenase family protein n=1 Tax=Ferrovibrio sp. TaxID=1917215 RepID=UPI002610A5D8|nr:phytanoyl-CoA dioxygenase family protein [Ferrovibrio sp.]